MQAHVGVWARFYVSLRASARAHTGAQSSYIIPYTHACMHARTLSLMQSRVHQYTRCMHIVDVLT